MLLELRSTSSTFSSGDKWSTSALFLDQLLPFPVHQIKYFFILLRNMILFKQSVYLVFETVIFIFINKNSFEFEKKKNDKNSVVR